MGLIRNMISVLSGLLPDLPATLVDDLAREFNDVKIQYISGHWAQALATAGRFCEAAYSILAGKEVGVYPEHASKPRNFLDSCEKLSHAANLSDSERLMIPRVLVVIYTFRNKRNGGHIHASGINTDKIDATTVVGMMKWVLLELVQNINPKADTGQVQNIIRQLSYGWEVTWLGPDGILRVVQPGMTAANQTLLLLAQNTNGTLTVDELILACNYTNASQYRKKVLGALVKNNYVLLLEDKVYLAPNGIRHIDEIVQKLEEV